MTDASSLMKSQERNLESNTVMWLDANIDSTEDNRRAKARLRQTINYLRTFDDADQCVECISLVRTENIFLIVSGSLGQTVVPLIHDTRHVQSIYVFCSNKEWHEKWVTKFRKVRGVYTDIKHICEALEEQVHISSNDMSGLISVLSSSNSNNEKQEASFMYFQLLIEILLEIDSSDESKQELIEQCSKQYEENEKELAYIEEFHKKYEPNRAIWWYTRECFLYRMLNKALRVYNAMGDYSKALDYYEKTLELDLKTLGPNHPSVATTYNNIGGVYNAMGDYSKALDYYEKTLELKLKTLGPNHPSVATTYNNIGLVYNAMGDYSKALDYYEKTLELELKTLGPNHPSVATTYNNIGGVYNAMGDYSKALDYYEKTLELDLKTLGPNHPSVATTYNHMGFLYKNQKRYREAKKYFEMSLAIREKALPSTHPHVLSGQQQLAEVTSIYQSV
ncbi:unnamed protein product [Didymodactylos carnosus]|uniref:Kinesin light chain n=1 Tax=Didymodactylos carnosus TaxID=1234261 RepID=A0A8S2KCR5_9BILA|nr:unnamed protein product [Didymodactylos carnosus]